MAYKWYKFQVFKDVEEASIDVTAPYNYEYYKEEEDVERQAKLNHLIFDDDCDDSAREPIIQNLAQIPSSEVPKYLIVGHLRNVETTYNHWKDIYEFLKT